MSSYEWTVEQNALHRGGAHSPSASLVLPPCALSHSHGLRKERRGHRAHKTRLVYFQQSHEPPFPDFPALPSQFLLSAHSQFSLSPLTKPSRLHPVPGPPSLSGNDDLPSTALHSVFRCTQHEVSAWRPSRSQPSQREDTNQTPQPAVLAFLHLLSSYISNPISTPSFCVCGIPARLDDSQFQPFHRLVSTSVQAASLLGKVSFF